MSPKLRPTCVLNLKTIRTVGFSIIFKFAKDKNVEAFKFKCELCLDIRAGKSSVETELVELLID